MILAAIHPAWSIGGFALLSVALACLVVPIWKFWWRPVVRLVARIATALAERKPLARRCPRCDYDLAATIGLTCPECGHGARTEGELHRRRFGWRWVLTAPGLVCAAYFLGWAGPRMQRSGWMGAVPTTYLAWSVGRNERDQFDPQTYCFLPPSAAATELLTRLKAEELWNWQWELLMRQARVVRSRDVWPRTTPFAVLPKQPRWLFGAGNMQFEYLTTKNVRPKMSNRWDPKEFPSEGGTDGWPVVSISQLRYHMLWDFEPTIVDKPEDAMAAVAGPELDAAVRSALAVSLARENFSGESESESKHWVLRALSRPDNSPLLKDVATGITIDVVHDGRVEGSAWLSYVAGYPRDARVSLLKLYYYPGSSKPAELDGWSVRIRGDALRSLDDFDQTRYWSGEFTVPLREVMEKAK